MLKVIGLGLLSLSVALIGFLYSDRLLFRKRYLEQLVLFSKGLINEMQGRNLNIFSILSKISADELIFLKNIKRQEIADFNSVRKTVKNAGIFNEDIDTVTEFIVNLGTSDIKGQTTHCEYYCSVFSEYKKQAEQNCYEKGKPSKTLSVLSGVALFIILI